MTQQFKLLSCKTDDLYSIPRTHLEKPDAVVHFTIPALLLQDGKQMNCPEAPKLASLEYTALQIKTLPQQSGETELTPKVVL